MAKKIRIYTILAIVFIIICTVVAISVVNGSSVASVSNVNMNKNTSDMIKIGWEEVENADGYRIYVLNNKSGEYEKKDDVPGGENCSYIFKNLSSATVYKIKVTAVKMFHDKEYESDDAEEVTVYSLPASPDLSLSSPEEGVMNAQWDEQENVSGYELQYSKSYDFSDAQDEILSETSFTVKKLTPKAVYYARARAFAEIDRKTIYSGWCKTAKIEINKKVVMNSDIDPNKPIVALSFDDGPAFDENGVNSTMQILDVLEEHGARATFFMCGSRINDSTKKILEREVELGCELGNHTYSHKNYGKKVTADDIKKCSEAIKDASGSYPTIFRCPGGIMSDVIQEECRKEGMPIAYWSVEPQDWKVRDADKIYKSVMSHVYDGSIILMHDIYPTTAQAVEKIVPKLIEEGYQVVGVSEMIAAKNNGSHPKTGQQYIDYKTINNNT